MAFALFVQITERNDREGRHERANSRMRWRWLGNGDHAIVQTDFLYNNQLIKSRNPAGSKLLVEAIL